MSGLLYLLASFRNLESDGLSLPDSQSRMSCSANLSAFATASTVYPAFSRAHLIMRGVAFEEIDGITGEPHHHEGHPSYQRFSDSLLKEIEL